MRVPRKWVRFGTVYTLEELEQELARQPQCSRHAPKGPWYGSFADPWPYPWQPGNGVFTPFPEPPETIPLRGVRVWSMPPAA